MDPKTIANCRKAACEDMRKAARALRASGDHGTVMQITRIIERLTEMREVAALQELRKP